MEVMKMVMFGMTMSITQDKRGVEKERVEYK
jgi:hypothetical protein